MIPCGAHTLDKALTFMAKTGRFVFSGIKIYLFWITVHYITSHLYPHLCADLSFYGFITSAVYVMTPHCRALAWLQNTSQMAIQNMWMVLGAWFCAKLLPHVGTPENALSSSKKKKEDYE